MVISGDVLVKFLRLLTKLKIPIGAAGGQMNVPCIDHLSLKSTSSRAMPLSMRTGVPFANERRLA